MKPLLRVAHLRVAFGGVTACEDVTFQVAPNEIVGLIGPNGAGKSTVFNAITRMAPATGEIQVGDATLLHGNAGARWSQRLRGRGAHRVIQAGIARTFQTPALFASLTVLDNLLVGQESRLRHGLLASVLGLPHARREEAAARARAHEVLAYLGLSALAERRAGALSLAEQKRVELARALCASPRLLLLDEPAAGLLHAEVTELGALIRRLRDELQLTVVLIEHHMGLVMSLSDRVVVLSAGRILAQGAPQAVAADPAVIEAYLGKGTTVAQAR